MQKIKCISDIYSNKPFLQYTNKIGFFVGIIFVLCFVKNWAFSIDLSSYLFCCCDFRFVIRQQCLFNGAKMWVENYSAAVFSTVSFANCGCRKFAQDNSIVLVNQWFDSYGAACKKNALYLLVLICFHLTLSLLCACAFFTHYQYYTSIITSWLKSILDGWVVWAILNLLTINFKTMSRFKIYRLILLLLKYSNTYINPTFHNFLLFALM